VSLVKRKLYAVLSDLDADKVKQLRLIDESGDDYLFPDEYFVKANLSKDTLAAVFNAA